MAKIVYSYGEVETAGRLAAAVVYIFFCLVLYGVYRARLFLQLAALGICAVVWINYQTTSAYYLKAGLNLIWTAGPILIWKYFYSR